MCSGSILFIEAEYEQYGSLKTLSYNQIVAVDAGRSKKSAFEIIVFKSYLKEGERT